MITESERAYDDFFVRAKLPDAMTRALEEAISRDSEILRTCPTKTMKHFFVEGVCAHCGEKEQPKESE